MRPDATGAHVQVPLLCTSSPSAYYTCAHAMGGHIPYMPGRRGTTPDDHVACAPAAPAQLHPGPQRPSQRTPRRRTTQAWWKAWRQPGTSHTMSVQVYSCGGRGGRDQGACEGRGGVPHPHVNMFALRPGGTVQSHGTSPRAMLCIYAFASLELTLPHLWAAPTTTAACAPPRQSLRQRHATRRHGIPLRLPCDVTE